MSIRLMITTTAMLAVMGCGGETGANGDSGTIASDGSIALADAGLEDSGSDSGGPDAGSEPIDAGRSAVTVRIVASGEPFPHADGISGQTARMTVAGVRSLALYRSMGDPDPVVVYLADGEDAAVSYAPGDETTLVSFDAATLTPGTYTFGRLVQSYARYEVDATLHRVDGAHDGTSENLLVIADDTEVDGVMHDAGHYELAFTAPDATAEWTGEDAPFPYYSTTSGAIGVVEAGEWAVYFPIDLVIDEALTVDSTLTLEVNMYESFRWTDLLLLGYRPGVFDISDISFEPVARFGGNSFDLELAPE